MLQLLLDGHDTLRSILADTPEGPRLVTREPGTGQRRRPAYPRELYLNRRMPNCLGYNGVRARG